MRRSPYAEFKPAIQMIAIFEFILLRLPCAVRRVPYAKFRWANYRFYKTSSMPALISLMTTSQE